MRDGAGRALRRLAADAVAGEEAMRSAAFQAVAIATTTGSFVVG